jgi:hypothetical protein
MDSKKNYILLLFGCLYDIELLRKSEVNVNKSYTGQKLNSSITSSLESHYQISSIFVKQFKRYVRSGRRVYTAPSSWVHFT